MVRLVVDQDQARRLSVTSQDIAQALSALFSGTSVTQLRDDIFLIDVVARGVADDRQSLASIRNMQLNLADGRGSCRWPRW